jgi:hypothetical protein
MISVRGRLEELSADYKDDYGEDISKDSIDKFLTFLELTEARRPSITCTPDGDIQAAWSSDSGDYISISFNTNRNIFLYIKDNKKG